MRNLGNAAGLYSLGPGYEEGESAILLFYFIFSLGVFYHAGLVQEMHECSKYVVDTTQFGQFDV